jgi:hypothetical protein
MSRIELDTSDIGGPAELYAHLRRMADRDLVLEVRLKGMWGDDWAACDWDRLEDELAPLFFQLRLVISPAGITAQDVEAYPERTVIGSFVRIARREMEGKEGEELLVAEEAFRRGLAHLSGRP